MKSNSQENKKKEIKDSQPTVKRDISKTLYWIYASIFILIVSFKLNQSSVGMWNQIMNDGSSLKRGVIAGTPRFIRSDEWLGQTVFYLSNYYNDFKPENPSWGPGKIATFINNAVMDYVVFFRPYEWGALVLGVERGYSYYWAFKFIGLLVASYMFFFLFTKGNWLISILAGPIIWLSSGTQWWLSTGLPEIITFFLFISLFFYKLINEERSKFIFLYSFLVAYFGLCFILQIYPPYQVPLGYFFLAIIIGYLIDFNRLTAIKINLKIKLLGIFLILASIVGFLLYFFFDTWEVTDVMSHTAYPGTRRYETGGTGFPVPIFNEFLYWYFSQEKVPSNWPNICESAGYIILFPVIFIYAVIYYVQNRKIHYPTVAFLLVVALLLAWHYITFPLPLAQITLLSLAPNYRTCLIFGLGNLVFSILFISTDMKIRNLSLGLKIALIMGSIVLAYLQVSSVNTSSKDFFKNENVILITILLSVFYSLFFFKDEIKYGKEIAVILMLLFLLRNMNVNPVNNGLAPILKNQYSQVIREIVEKDKDAYWVSFGGLHYPGFLKANGAKVLNGLYFLPYLDRFKILDRGGKNDSIYNRNAYFLLYPLGHPDSVKFTLGQSDLFYAQIDPCSPKFDSLNVKYYMFPYEPSPYEIRCMEPVLKSNINIYKKIH